MTPALCAYIAATYGYAFFGVEDGQCKLWRGFVDDMLVSSRPSVLCLRRKQEAVLSIQIYPTPPALACRIQIASLVLTETWL